MERHARSPGPSTIDTLATGNWAAPGVFVSPTAVVERPADGELHLHLLGALVLVRRLVVDRAGRHDHLLRWNFGDSNTGSGHDDEPHVRRRRTPTTSADHPRPRKGNTASVTKPVTVSNVVSPGIAFVAQANTNGNATSETVTVPANVAAGNALVLVATGRDRRTADGACRLDAARHVVRGQRQRHDDRVEQGRHRHRSRHERHCRLPGHRARHGPVARLFGDERDRPSLAASASKATQMTGTSYATPTTNVPANGDVVISVWSAKSSAVTGWTTPAGQTVRSVANGSGGGRVNSVATDAGRRTPGRRVASRQRRPARRARSPPGRSCSAPDRRGVRRRLAAARPAASG